LNETVALLLKEGGAIAALVVVFFILKLLMPLLQKKEPGENGHSGGKPVSFWREEFRKIVKDALEEEFAGRNESIRRMIREELQGLRK